MAHTLAELIQRFGGEIKGDPDHRITGIGSLQTAGPSEISFLNASRFRSQLDNSRAGAVVLRAEDAAAYSGNCLITEHPYAYFAKVAGLLHPLAPVKPGIHATAAVDESAKVAPSASIGAHATVDAGAVIGERVLIGPGCWIGADCIIGDDTRLYASVSIYSGCVIGKRGTIHAGAVIGGDGFGYANEDGQWIRIPQIGKVIIGDDVNVGANTTIDRGAMEDTVIEDGVILDNLIQIAHNVHVGANTAMAGCVGIAGSARIGARCTLAGRVGVSDHVEIVDDVHIAATSLVSHSVKTPGVYSGAMPMEEAREWRRIVVRIRQLDELARRLKQLEKELPTMTKGDGC